MSVKANQNKGEIPIAKNVIVVDEQGNEYEATYPKRAKGLVKNGRARFISENKICLACPPDKFLEEEKMSDNITKSQVYNQIVELQRSLAPIERILYQVNCVRDSQPCVEPDEGEAVPLDYSPDVALEKIKTVHEAVTSRERTVNAMLDFYLNLYRSLEESETSDE